MCGVHLSCVCGGGGTWETRKVYDEKPDKIERERGGGEGKGEEGRA